MLSSQYVYILVDLKSNAEKPPAAATAAVTRMPDHHGRANSEVHREALQGKRFWWWYDGMNHFSFLHHITCAAPFSFDVYASLFFMFQGKKGYTLVHYCGSVYGEEEKYGLASDQNIELQAESKQRKE